MERRAILKYTTALLGYTVTGSVLNGFLGGCKADHSSDWKPSFFSEDETETISELAETIIPKTDTPGAKDLLVHRFIDKMVDGAFSEEEKKFMKEGISGFISDCKTKFNKNFEELKTDEKSRMIGDLETSAAKIPPSIWGTQIGDFKPAPFYRKIKELILIGYFSSEYVGEKILKYVPIPGEQRGCVPLQEIGNAYSIG